jgi:hypothetical protein
MLRIAMVGIAAAAVFVAGCTTEKSGGGGGDTPDPTATPPLTYNVPPEISAQQLQGITLALADFGPRYTTFETVLDSELTTTVERALDACDPFREQTALGRYGWSKAYARAFGEGMGDDLPANVHVASVVDVYSSPDNASTKIRYDTKQIHEDQLAPGGCGGVGFEKIETLGLPTVGDQSWAVRINFAVVGFRGTRHMLMFRRDKIVATVMITRLNSEDSSLELMALALKMDERLVSLITAPLTVAPATGEREEF